MIVCVCHRISDRGVTDAIDRGAHSADEIALATRAGTSCGCCREAVEALVRERTPCKAVPCAGCTRTHAGRAQEAA